jgi:1-deoxy-D-xylulose-5-phosphate synthase
LVKFGEKFPDRFFDTGIAEAHAGCFAAGLAAEGVKPYLTVYSTFLQRAFDQIIHDIGIQNLPVIFCMDRAGVVGEDGPTHHGTFDLSYLSAVPNVSIAVPKDGNELRAMLHYTSDHDLGGPLAIRYPRDAVPNDMTNEVHAIEWNKWERMTDPAEITVLATGSTVWPAVAAAKRLTEEGTPVAVVNARFVKPLDTDALDQAAGDSSIIITAEEGSLKGGFGSAVADYLLTHKFPGRFKSLGISDEFVVHGARSKLLELLGLDEEGLYRSIKQIASKSDKSSSLLRKLGLKKSSDDNEDEQISIGLSDSDKS